MIDITITDDEFQSLVIYAERYAIGRMTYAPDEVNQIIRKYLPRIANNTLGVLIEDIERELAIVGMYFDKTTWLELLEFLKNERDRRESEDG